ncbi:nucleoside diphosphate kinase [Pavlovales sp. CCMP2436]|nr:nucleoside diphosphate kinase [Pavlovales sp. CCMP2436]
MLGSALLICLPGDAGEAPAADGVATALREKDFAIRQKMVTLSVEEAAAFYAEHDGTAQFAQLVAALSRGPLVAFALELPGAAAALAALGSTPAFAPPLAYHISPPADVQRELKFFFPEVFPKETTFALLKPDVEEAGARADVIAVIEAKGFVVVAELTETLSATKAQALMPAATAVELAFLTSAPSCLLALEKPFAIGDLALIVGPAEPLVAREVAPASLRSRFGTDALKNAVAVSISSDEAAAQLAIAFGAQAFVSAPEQHAVALVLPGATAAGKAAAITDALRAAGFKIVASKVMPVSASVAKQLLPGVPDALVEYATSGVSTVICVSRPHCVRALASLVGPAGAAIASTMSALLGPEGAASASEAPVVCSATPEAAASAVQLLFPELLAMQTTLAIIKPDAVGAGSADAIVARIEAAGFSVRARTSLALPGFKAEEFYAEHAGKAFLPNLVAFMSSGPCVALALSRPGAILEWRALMGPTRTATAREQAPGSLRALYGTDGTRNATHGSDSVLSARRELKFWFPELSVEPLPKPDEVGALVREQLEPSLVAASRCSRRCSAPSYPR